MKIFYCANCGTRLRIFRKALPKYGRIIDLVEHHLCPSEPVSIDLTPDPGTPYVETGKFVETLDELKNNVSSNSTDFTGVGTEDLRDRRSAEFTKPDIEPTSSAPPGLIDQMKSYKE